MKSFVWPKWWEFLIVVAFETIHVSGTAILFFIAFPGLDSLRAVMCTNAIALLPALFKLVNALKPVKFKVLDLLGKINNFAKSV